MSFLVEDLITSAKKRGFAPTSQSTFATSDFILLANEELLTKLVPLMLGVREDFFLSYSRQNITAQKQRYAMPERAIANSLKFLYHVDGNGRRQQRFPKTRVSDITVMQEEGSPEQMLLAGDEIMLFPKPNQSLGYLETWFFSRPNRLIATESCAKITAINSVGGTTTFTVDTDLTGSFSVGSKIDLISAASPFLRWAEDQAITAISATEIAVATSGVSDEAGTVEPQLNDYICPKLFSNIPMIPIELHPMLAHMTAMRTMQGLGDLEKLASMREELKELAVNSFKMIGNRVESEVEHIVDFQGILSAVGSW